MDKSVKNIFLTNKSFYVSWIHFDQRISTEKIYQYMAELRNLEQVGSSLSVYKHIGREVLEVFGTVYQKDCEIPFQEKQSHELDLYRVQDLDFHFFRQSVYASLRARFDNSYLKSKSDFEKMGDQLRNFAFRHKVKDILEEEIFRLGRIYFDVEWRNLENEEDCHDSYFRYDLQPMRTQMMMLISEKPILDTKELVKPKGPDTLFEDQIRAKNIFSKELGDLITEIKFEVWGNDIFKQINLENLKRLSSAPKEKESWYSDEEDAFVRACFIEFLLQNSHSNYYIPS